MKESNSVQVDWRKIGKIVKRHKLKVKDEKSKLRKLSKEGTKILAFNVENESRDIFKFFKETFPSKLV